MKRSPGQPTKYKPEYCEAIIEAGKRGDSFLEFAGSIDVHTDTLAEWCVKHPEFSVAFKKAKKFCEQYFVRLGRAGMLGQKSERMPGFNSTMWIFWMKARFGWKDDPDPEIDETDLEVIS